MTLFIFLYISILAWFFSKMLAVPIITFTIRQSEEQKELVGITTSSFFDNNSKGKTTYFNRNTRETTYVIACLYYITNNTILKHLF
ncbi:hypothetical protein EXW58_26595 (plasmid) [Bacillus mycoides]|nr:hypothetical protein EXW58_26595 [Bacillus mycoides]